MKRRRVLVTNGGYRLVEDDNGELVEYLDRYSDAADEIILEVNGERVGFDVVNFLNGGIKIVAKGENNGR